MAGELAVRIEKRYAGGALILADFALDLAAGDTTILFGPSGAGKTTVLRCLAGLETPDRGLIRFGEEIWFDGRAGICLTPQARRVGFLAQDYALFPHLSVRENVEYGLAGKSRAERQQAAARMLEFFEITKLAGRKPPEISGGEAQRVALARALAPSPRLLLLDEPLSALDVPTRSRVRTELHRHLRAIRIPSLLVTHDRTEAVSLGHNIVVMVEGDVRQAGPVEEVFRRPAGTLVAATVGVETVVRGEVAEEEDGVLAVRISGGVVHAVSAEDFGPGDAVLVCIRGEEVTLQEHTAGRESARNHFSGAVTAIEKDGAVERVSLDCGFPLVATITRRSREDMELKPGVTVTAAVKATAVHLIRL
ncbi:MAG: ABC transporter ATP-binding protein [Bryobacterales bacterium]|nr:ABC transporter ATP-binding protein [Bryobacterales bacterium]